MYICIYIYKNAYVHAHCNVRMLMPCSNTDYAACMHSFFPKRFKLLYIQINFLTCMDFPHACILPVRVHACIHTYTHQHPLHTYEGL